MLENLKSAIKSLFKDNIENVSSVIETIKQSLLELEPTTIGVSKGKVAAVRKIADASDEYVYDIGMSHPDRPWFFGNNVLVHNSCYFSAYKSLQKEIDSGAIQWSKETVISLYDQIAENINDSFPQMMLEKFHCPLHKGKIIRANREVVAEQGLYITKKRYAVLIYDKEGKRLDVNGKPGKIKAMGLDLKRSDTPKYMQDYLMSVLSSVLNGVDENSILENIKKFRTEFRARPGWEKGSPKRANNITEYAATEAKNGKTNMPGHVRAAINWNTLKRVHNDRYSMNIVDGMKVIVCKLKSNPLGYTSVAYPVDERRLPQWFLDLPFAHDEMEDAIIDSKLDNLIGVLKWDLASTKESNTFNSLFDFE